MSCRGTRSLAVLTVGAALITGACASRSPRVMAGVVVDEHGAVVAGARVVLGYHGWAWEPYLVWDHFHAVETITDDRGRFRLEIEAPEHLRATVEAEHGAVRSVAVTAGLAARLIVPAAGPRCACWRYDGPMLLVEVPLGAETTLSSTAPRHAARLGRLAHRLRAERGVDRPREITVTVRGGQHATWVPGAGTYGTMLDYHPPLDALSFDDAPTVVSLGDAAGLLLLRDGSSVLALEIPTGIGTRRAGDREHLLLPARWVEWPTPR